MEPKNNTGRLAGIVYFLLLLFGPFSLIYVPNLLIVRGDAAATVRNIRNSEMLFRLGLASELAGDIVFIVAVMLLYRLLNNVDRMQAALMVIFAVLSVPIHFAGVASDIVALVIIKGSSYLSVFNPQQLDALAMLFVTLHGRAFIVIEVFWGLWLLPFGILVYKSGFLPRILGILLVVNCFGFLAQSLAGVVFPDSVDVVARYAFLTQFGEIWIILWLLIKGAKARPAAEALPATP